MRPRRRDRHRHAPSQAGAGMIEVLLAIVLASITVVALAQALLTLVVTSGSVQERQRLSTALSGYSESLRQLDWEPCAPGGLPTGQTYADIEAAQADRFQAPAGVTLVVTRIEYWDRATATFATSCPSGGTGAQRLSISATSSKATRTAQVVKVQW